MPDVRHFCTSCGASVLDGTSFCVTCGAPVTPDPPPSFTPGASAVTGPVQAPSPAVDGTAKPEAGQARWPWVLLGAGIGLACGATIAVVLVVWVLPGLFGAA